MKTWMSALAICCVSLAGCRPSSDQLATTATLERSTATVVLPTDTPTLERSTATVVLPTDTPTSPSVQEPTATLTPEAEGPQTPAPDQEALKDAWRSAINNAIILSSACEWMFETHANFQQGEIDIEKAKSQLSIEADFISFTRWDSPAAYQNETVAEFMWSLEMEMGGLIELIDATDEDMIGSAEVLDILFRICGSLLDLQSGVVFTAMDAGLTEESIDELDVSDTDMFADFYEMIFGEN